eukprot:5815815-Pleurochrysis_carterae.AAC.2
MAGSLQQTVPSAVASGLGIGVVQAAVCSCRSGDGCPIAHTARVLSCGAKRGWMCTVEQPLGSACGRGVVSGADVNTCCR